MEGSSSAAETTSESRGTYDRELTIPASFELCTVTPSRASELFQAAPLFSFRGILRVAAGSFPLPSENGNDADAWIPFNLETPVTSVAGTEGEGSLRVEADMVPSSVFFLAEAEGWETVVYTDNPEAPTLAGERLLIQAAFPSGGSDFSLGSVAELDQERRLHVVAFVPATDPEAPVTRAETAPCVLTDATFDRIDVMLAEGFVSFHTRPAFWRRFFGFTVLAQGDVDGISFEVDDYADLEYSTSDFGGSNYGVRPLLAVRFAEGTDGPCILVVEWDKMTVGDEVLASLLDCDQNKLRDLTVESVEVVAGGGESRW